MTACKWCGDALPEDVELEHPESHKHPQFKEWLFCREECKKSFKECQCHKCGGDMMDEGPDGGTCIDCGWSDKPFEF